MDSLQNIKTEYNIVGGKKFNKLVDIVQGNQIDFTGGPSIQTKFGTNIVAGRSGGSGFQYVMPFDFSYTDALSANPGNQLYITSGKTYIHGNRVIQIPASIITLSGTQDCFIYARINMIDWASEITWSSVLPTVNETEINIPLHHMYSTTTYSSAVSADVYSITYVETYHRGDIHFSTIMNIPSAG